MPRSLGILLALSLVLLSAGSCGPAPQNGVYATQPRLLFVEAGGVEQPIDGQSLRAGQIWALVLDLQYAAHVYVIQRRGDVLVDIYPGVGVPDVKLGRGTVRLPGPESWMRVPQLDKQSRMCVLIDPQPIPPEFRRCPSRNRAHAPLPTTQVLVLPHVR